MHIGNELSLDANLKQSSYETVSFRHSGPTSIVANDFPCVVPTILLFLIHPLEWDTPFEEKQTK